jgi:phage protein D
MQISTPYFKILYNTKNITSDVSVSLIALTYIDKVSGESDEMEITLEDKEGKWQNQWYPEKGSLLTVTIGIDGKELDCGVFQIDQIEFSGPPDQVVIKALSSGYYGKMRTRKGYAHENKTLSEIVHSIAAKIGFTVIGSIENVRIARSTQNRESDLQYLHRLASEYGYNFTIKNKTIVFIKQTELEARSSSLIVDKTEVTGYGFRDKTSDVFKGTQIRFHNPNTNKIVSASQPASFSGEQKEYTDQLDTLEIWEKVENEQQATIKAQAYIHKKVSLQQTGGFSAPGNVLLISGNNIDLTGFGAFSGIWHILTSTHAIGNGGYTTDVEIKRINITDAPGKKLPKRMQHKTTNYKVK